MAEEEWLACEDPGAMARLVWLPKFDRHLRLFACACCRAAWSRVTVPRCRTSVEVAERFAYGLATDKERRLATVAAHRGKPQSGPPDANWVAADCTGQIAYHAAEHAIRLMLLDRPTFVAFLRDIFGNPFRPVSFSPEWRTDTAVALGRTMYESRDFSAMPILADALQDAGCDNTDVLNHCRGPQQVHVRGCWVVDLVLGKN